MSQSTGLTLPDAVRSAFTCARLLAALLVWEILGREAMRILFTAHPGQIDGLCCGHRLLSVYNVAFALHWPDPATPRGNWFLSLCCPFTSLSFSFFSSIPFVWYFFCSILSSPPLAFCLYLPISLWFGTFSISFYICPFSLACCSLWLSCQGCLFYCVLQYLQASGKSLPVDSSPHDFPVSSSSFFATVALHLVFFFHFPPSMSPVFTPSVCHITRSFPLSLLSLFVFLSFFQPILSVCAFTASEIPSSSLPSVSVYWILSPAYSMVDKWIIASTHKNLSRPFFLSRYSYFMVVILTDYLWRNNPRQPQGCTYFAIFYLQFSGCPTMSHVVIAKRIIIMWFMHVKKSWTVLSVALPQNLPPFSIFFLCSVCVKVLW